MSNLPARNEGESKQLPDGETLMLWVQKVEITFLKFEFGTPYLRMNTCEKKNVSSQRRLQEDYLQESEITPMKRMNLHSVEVGVSIRQLCAQCCIHYYLCSHIL